jgi:N,N'-diacetyllegionaminate synthase
MTSLSAIARGETAPCYVIAEAGSNHNGDLDTAIALIDAAAEARADAVKFQSFSADGIYSRFTPPARHLVDKGAMEQQESMWDLMKRLELPNEWLVQLRDHALSRGLDFLSTPFEESAVDVLVELDVPAIKIASYEITHLPLIEYAARSGLPLLLSTGGADLHDIELALKAARNGGGEDIVLLQCTLDYPPKAETLNLRAITTLRQAFGLPVGYSDHSMGTAADVAAVALGAVVIEKHFTLDRHADGPDHTFSLTPDELITMVSDIRFAEAALGNGRKQPSPSEADNRRIGRRSFVASRPIASGTVITEELLAVKRPGFGIPAALRDAILGRTARRDIEADEILIWDMF